MMAEGELPWRRIPAWFYDNNPIPDIDVENDERLRSYRDIQKYFDKNVSSRAANEFLFGDAIQNIKLICLRLQGSAQTQARGELIAEAELRLPSGNKGFIRHKFNKAEHKISLDYLKPERPDEKFPMGFGREFFKRLIPALRELNMMEINIKASSVPSAGMNGAYTWSFYGFTNKKMRWTLERYVLYIEDYRGIFLDGRTINDIMKIERMKDLLKERYAMEFLKARHIGNMEWPGIIPNIFDENSIEMGELIEYLTGVK